MNVDRSLKAVEQILTSRQLNATELFILRQSWHGKTYEQMAQECGYGSVYMKEIGSRLWHDLSKQLGKRVTKKNLHLVINSYQLNYSDEQELGQEQKLPSNQQAENFDLSSMAAIEIEPPGALLPFNSSLYINRPPIEELAYSEISQPGCVISLGAARKMGKSSLLNRVIARAKTQSYETVCIDLREVDAAVFACVDKFLRWFCVNVSRQLNLSPKIEDYWDKEMGSKVSCKIYFEEYLLEQIATPLLLIVEEVDRVFEYSNIAQDFLSMLRFWHEQAGQVEIWQKLRLVLVHTTENYISLKLNQSPFNVGLSLRLPAFALEQVQQLAQRYQLDWASGESGLQRLAPLAEMVSGHPYLINVALYHLHQQAIGLEELLSSLPTEDGIYGDHLRSLLTLIQGEAQLALALQQVVTATQSVQLEPVVAYKLESLGLIQLVSDRARPSCELYRRYFRQHLAGANQLQSVTGTQTWESDRLSNFASHCLLKAAFATWHGFNNYLATNWQQWTQEIAVVSALVCEIDYFKFYNDSRGQIAGNACIQQIASIIHSCAKHQAILLASHGEQFAALLPSVDATVGFEVAENIRRQVKALGIVHDQSKMGGFPSEFVTLSLGVASTTPYPQSSPETLIAAAMKALLLSKRNGRDRVTVLSA